MASSMLAQGLALEHQMFICGLSQAGSSSVPAFSQSRSGVAASSLMMGDLEVLLDYFTGAGEPAAPTKRSTSSVPTGRMCISVVLLPQRDELANGGFGVAWREHEVETHRPKGIDRSICWSTGQDQSL